MSRKHIFVGMDDASRARRCLVFTILVGLFLIVTLAASSFFAGYEARGWADSQARKAKAELGNPKRAEPATYTPLLSCTKDGLQEWHRTCRARERLTKVGAP